MASQKQSLPSFASILSVLSIVFYCAGFLRVELELNQHKKRIIDLENNEENKLYGVLNRDKITKNTHGKFFFYSGLMWKSIIQNVYFSFSLTKTLASPENVAYRYLVSACSWSRGKENRRLKGHHWYVFFVGKKYYIGKLNSNRSLHWK